MMNLFRLRKKEKAVSLPKYGMPCLEGSVIFEKNAKSYLSEFPSLVSVPLPIYQELYLSTLYRLAEFCQSMPKDKDSAPYSLLIQQLTKSLFALKIRRRYLLPSGADSETIAEQESQWTYAVFSMSLCHQLYQVVYDRHIHLYDAEGESLGEWQPLTGRFYEPNHYFSIQWKVATPAINQQDFITILIHQIIPASALRWLAQNKPLLALWWDTLHDKSAKNNLTDILQQTIQVLSMDKSAKQKENIANNNKNESEKLAEKEAVVNKSEFKDGANANTTPQHPHSLDTLLTYLNQIVEQDNPFAWLRVQAGLFLNLNTLSVFLAEQKKWKHMKAFITANKAYLLDKSGQYYWEYRPLNYDEDERILTGIVIKESALNATWKAVTLNTEFKPSII